MSLPAAVAICPAAFGELGAFQAPIEQAGHHLHCYDIGLDEFRPLRPASAASLCAEDRDRDPD